MMYSQLSKAAVLAIFAELTAAAPAQGVSSAGISVSDVFPPASTKVNSVLFAPESVVGFVQPTPTGVYVICSVR